MEYKDTLNMPNTNFEMRGNLKDKDPKFINEWKENNLYKKLSEREAVEFILHDGPPYANGDIHAGHSMNKILKDIIVRDNALKGKAIDWRTGWDTHGLPIELKVQQSGIKLSEVGKDVYLEECKKYAYSQVEKQQEQFERLALLTDFNQKYLTLMPDFESRQINVFNTMLNKGLVYQDLKPVYWSWSSVTALAEAEIEYKDAEDWSIYVKFKHESGLNFYIWTTTPWTLPGNVAIAFGENIEYAKVEIDGEEGVVASDLIKTLSDKIEKEVKFIEVIDIKPFIGQTVTNPINQKTSKLVWGHHVTTEGGTGLVHTAGGHGQDDYMIVKNEGLELFVVMDDNGHMTNSGEYDGMFYLKANKLIIEALTENGGLLYAHKFTHSVPIDWRTKEPVIYRATKQWFVSIDKIKEGLISSTKDVNWHPGWGEERLIKMTENRSDWCISRQRLWGVPIPVIYDENGTPIVNEELQSNIEALFAKDGIVGWHKAEIKDLLPASIEYKEEMTKETDILDVWFDSGSSHTLLGDKVSDVYLEGNDQYRGWFNSSLITSYVVNGRAPYKTVITHGMALDKNGNKMSKSIGNTVDPLSIVDTYGADILRMWVATSDYVDNVRISDDIIKQISNDYRKIRNSIRFALGTTNDFEGYEGELSEFSKSVLNEIEKSWSVVRKSFSEYNFLQATKEVINQLTSGVIAYYLDFYKEVGYITKVNDPRRREMQHVISKILDYTLFSIAPIAPVTAEEGWKETKNSGSIFEATYPSFETYEAVDFNEFATIRSVVTKALEELRERSEVKKSNQAALTLTLPSELMNWSEILVKKNFMVASLRIEEGELSATAEDFQGIKCERCWNYFTHAEMQEDICKEECVSAVEEYK